MSTDVGYPGAPPTRLVVDRRLMGIAIVTEVFVVFLAYMVVYVPVLGPKLTRAEIDRFWLAAIGRRARRGPVGGLRRAWRARLARAADPLVAEDRAP